MPLERAYDDGESVLYAKRRGRPLVLLAGHTDTVPAQGNLPGRIEDGAVHGLGATDMKGGLAVMIELARWAAETELAYDLGLLFFPREELGPADNPLPGVFAAAPLVDEAALVICLEPTDNTLQLGCLGNLNARLVFEGVSAHSARPWLGVNAVKLAIDGLREILELEPRDAVVDGLLFREVLVVTQIHGGVATNVIPARVECNAQLPLRARPHAGRGRGARARARRARRRDRPELGRRARRPRATASSRSCAASATSRCSRSRRGRTSPTSPPAASTRSTSARARRATRTRSTSRSRSPRSSGRSRRCSGSCQGASARAIASSSPGSIQVSRAVRANVHRRTRSRSSSSRSAKRCDRLYRLRAEPLAVEQVLRRVVGRVADERLRIDHEPRLSLGAEHVARMKVGGEQDVTRRRAR